MPRLIFIRAHNQGHPPYQAAAPFNANVQTNVMNGEEPWQGNVPDKTPVYFVEEDGDVLFVNSQNQIAPPTWPPEGE